MPNTLVEFVPAKFTNYGYCADCDHNGVVPRLDESMTTPALKQVSGAVPSDHRINYNTDTGRPASQDMDSSACWCAIFTVCMILWTT